MLEVRRNDFFQPACRVDVLVSSQVLPASVVRVARVQVGINAGIWLAVAELALVIRQPLQSRIGCLLL